MLAYLETSVGWTELLKRTVKETMADKALGLAAQLAYYFFLSLFPALLVLLAFASLFVSGDLVSRLVSMASGTVPPEVITLIRDQLVSISQGDQGGIVTFGVAAAIWSSSAAMVAIIDSLNTAYDVEEGRPWWKQRLIAIALTVGGAAFVLLSFALVVAGPELAQYVSAQAGLGPAFEWTWKIVQWPLVFVLISGALAVVYYYAPDVEQDFVFLTPGSILATGLWLLGSVAFRIYVVNFGSYNETYGAIGGVIVLLLWLYLSGLVIIVGAEMNAEIEHASPYGKDKGEKVPGQRKSIGARAAREYRERQQQQPKPEPQQAPRPVAVRPRWSPGSAMARSGVVITAAVATLLGRRIGS